MSSAASGRGSRETLKVFAQAQKEPANTRWAGEGGKMKITLIRHGMTYGNTLHQYIGVTDQPLCEEGKKELSLLVQEQLWPETAGVFVSPMKRARETAGILFPDAAQTVVENLREMNFGVFEERSYIDMKDDSVYQDWVDGKCEGPIPKGEIKEAFTRRCRDAFLEVLSGREEDAVFVVHGGTIMAVLSEFGQPERGYYDWYVKNGHGFVCEWDGARLTVLEEK